MYNKNRSIEIYRRRAKELRISLAPQWNIIPDCTKTHYTPHAFTIDSPNRKNTLLCKSDLAMVTETKPRFKNMIACKTVDEYKRTHEKTGKFYLDEDCAANPAGPSHGRQPTSTENVQVSKVTRNKKANTLSMAHRKLATKW